MPSVTYKILKDGMNFHQFGQAIQENKHLYTVEEYMNLFTEWGKDYEQYLIDLVKHAKVKK